MLGTKLILPFSIESYPATLLDKKRIYLAFDCKEEAAVVRVNILNKIQEGHCDFLHFVKGKT